MDVKLIQLIGRVLGSKLSGSFECVFENLSRNGLSFSENFHKVENNLIYAETALVLQYHKPRTEILNGQSFSAKLYRTPKAPSNLRAVQAQYSISDLEEIFHI